MSQTPTSKRPGHRPVILVVGNAPEELLPHECRREVVADGCQAVHAALAREYDWVLVRPKVLLEMMCGPREQAAA